MKRLEKGAERCSIVRVGGRCQSEALQGYTIHAQLKQHTTSIQSSRQLRVAYEEIDSVQERITVGFGGNSVKFENAESSDSNAFGK